MESTKIQQAHSILDFLLTKAAVSGKVYKSTLRIPYFELKDSINEQDFEYEDIDLQITIKLKWVPSQITPMEPADV